MTKKKNATPKETCVSLADDGVTNIYHMKYFAVRQDTLEAFFHVAILGLCQAQATKDGDPKVIQDFDLAIDTLLLDFKIGADFAKEMREFQKNIKAFKYAALDYVFNKPTVDTVQ